MDFEDLVHPRHAALIVVDVQNDFCDSNGALAETRCWPPGATFQRSHSQEPF
jgi:hypothetical protein